LDEIIMYKGDFHVRAVYRSSHQLSSKAYRSPTGRDSSVVILAKINDRFAES
jgi:hypothetical protein